MWYSIPMFHMKVCNMVYRHVNIKYQQIQQTLVNDSVKTKRVKRES